MIFIETQVTEELFNEIMQRSKEDKYAITDYAFEYLYDKGYIKNEKEFRGAHFRKNGDNISLLCMTDPERKHNYTMA